MNLILCEVKFRKNYDSEWKHGICISSSDSLNDDGSVIHDKYFSLEINEFGVRKIVPFEYKDMFEVLYYTPQQHFTMGKRKEE